MVHPVGGKNVATVALGFEPLFIFAMICHAEGILLSERIAVHKLRFLIKHNYYIFHRLGTASSLLPEGLLRATW
jgi:hypothetical protein